MDFKDISNKELRELNLYPINKFKNFKIRCDTGYYDIYCKRDNHEKIFQKSVGSLQNYVYICLVNSVIRENQTFNNL